MDTTTTPFQKFNIYLSTLLVWTCFMMTLGIVSMIKQPMAQEFNLSETFLGILDGISFLSTMLGCFTLAIYPIKKPVLGIFVISILLIISMESLILAKFTTTFRSVLLIFSRFLCGFFRSYGIVSYVILNYYLKGQRYQCLIQIWYSVGIVGDIISVVVLDYMFKQLQLDWSIGMTATLGLMLVSCIYLLISVKEFDHNQNAMGLSTMTDFIKQYWSNRVNLLHSFLFAISTLYYLMVLWLPYFFIQIGFKNIVLVSISYPLGFMLAGLIFQPIQRLFKNYLGFMFLVCLLIDNIGAIWLTQLGDDSEEIAAYFILIFITSILTSGYGVYTQTVDLNKRVKNNDEQIAILFPINGIIAMVFYFLQMVIVGVIMEKNLHRLFVVYAVMIAACTVFHFIRIIKFPNSLRQTEQTLQEESNQNSNSIN